MANKIIINKELMHYYDYNSPPVEQEPDKTKSISEMSQKELRIMLSRLREERELQQVIKEMKRNAGERDTYDKPFKVDTITPIDKLYHHGVLGMKWGVRRYQNADGTRTPRGKKRKRQEDAKATNRHQSKGTKPRQTKELTNEELRQVNERLQLETNYRRLSADSMKNSESWVKKSLSSAGEQALTEFSKGVMLGGAKLLVKELSPEFAETAFNIKDKKKG